MLPLNYSAKIGDRLVDLGDGKPFIVLCSCPHSRPRRHTRNYVNQKRHEFMTAEDFEKHKPSTGENDVQTA